MPWLVGLTLRGERKLDAAAVVARMQWLIIHPRLNVTKAVYPEHVARDAVPRLWDKHLAGADYAWDVGRRVTLEIWLQQVYAGRYRPVDAGTGVAEVGA